MAKIRHCVFCGKEITTGFFRGTANDLYLSEYQSVRCCDDCYEKYASKVEKIKDRFGVKVENYNISSKKDIDEITLAGAFIRYLAEEKDQYERCGEIEDYVFLGPFAYNKENGYFYIREFKQGDSFSVQKKINNLTESMITGDVWFSKDDISRIEFRITDTFGESAGAFSTIYEFDVRFNDEKNITYKPCITKMYFEGKGFLPSAHKKEAKLECIRQLELFKSIIGSNLPIIEVKKFY